MIFLSKGDKIDNLKTIRENNISEHNSILIMEVESEQLKPQKEEQKLPEEEEK